MSVSLPPVGKRRILRGPRMWANISPDSRVETDVRQWHVVEETVMHEIK